VLTLIRVRHLGQIKDADRPGGILSSAILNWLWQLVQVMFIQMSPFSRR